MALAACTAFLIRQRRAASPLYDLKVAGRRIFWVAAVAGIIVFGSLMAAMFVGQQYLQNVLGYDAIEAGAAILPAAALMVLIAPRSAKLVESHGARFTLLLGYAFCLLGFGVMFVLWSESSPYWQVGLGYALMGTGVGFAGTPASHSLTGSVPVKRVGMASGTADLQRDLGGAIMQSIFGAFLTAGYAHRRVECYCERTGLRAGQNNQQCCGDAAEILCQRRASRAAVPQVRQRHRGGRTIIVPRWC